MGKLSTLLFSAALSTAVVAGASAQEQVKIGMLQGFTGPTESLVKPMALGGELAIQEVSDSGLLLGGREVVSVRGDSTCIDAAAATAAADRLVTSDGVHGINGATCSGATTAILNNVVRANGIVMISPSATSPALTEIEDDGYFFRTAPSDARQGQIIAEILDRRGIGSAALTYTNNDYGKGLADAIQAAYEAKGGKITAVAAHEDGKADYSAEIGTLASAGGEVLIVAGYLDQGGKGIIQASLDTGAFETFVLPDGMVGEALTDNFGDALDGSIGTNPGTDSPGASMLAELASGKGFKGDDPYVPEAYDASALLLLAMQSAGSTDSAVYKDHIMKVANAPGEKIYPGELAKALQILADGGEIDYVGGTALELIAPGESAGSFRETEIKDGKWETEMYH
ncbi:MULTISPECIES: ABC transporter substrate-binding protein [Thalassospira]|jgi:branched-chain amino acid transport system substrate-binding protein|uniref:Branched-chain amino acid ABC transporter substrate-binding protein n=1 Tax=Thalassospira profundimaris TaxID=502049 RepID=A0A367V1F3_9PROT|nr:MULTISPECIES: ABC transporter substrate-binding protein [Thalassospira]MBR9901571.1 ABC transporter substrate-binding protein [Rhodospirillales bacterium]KZB69895.1 branched-chain amino acid ABC transporter substrate-binding protein [Thalassospira sp. MCCC 1A01148]MBO6808665.1 ABC transporter substrate-binding protein [Thalassospira sp.]MBO6839637.1 ABC transporter substrate-binding protein [Thalassospira sp.]MBS8274590.1 branched-chain amino acid ABC transporter substrate-binding protein [|tara:strand:- start:7508 stop:8704 length:1197 start_codon:yes stop_codon:yes gene_type:complete